MAIDRDLRELCWHSSLEKLTRTENLQPALTAAALDVGTRRDLTALVVGHAEQRESGRVVVIDRVLSWRPQDGQNGRVDLAEVKQGEQVVVDEAGMLDQDTARAP